MSSTPLDPVASERLSHADKVFTSDLSINEFALLHGAGFEPLDPWADPDAPNEFAAAHRIADPEEHRAALRRINTRLANGNVRMFQVTMAGSVRTTAQPAERRRLLGRTL